MRRTLIFILLILTLAACRPAENVVTATTAPTSQTVTFALPPTPTITLAPTQTINPLGDPDGDGFPTSYEETWGTDPQAFTTFEILKELPGVITGVLHTRQPYDLDSMNRTMYQQVRIIGEELIYDRQLSWNKVGPFSTLTVEFILFPYVADVVNEYVKKLETPYEFPQELEKFTHFSTTSDTCEEEAIIMEEIIKESKTLHELGERISTWNWNNLDNDFSWGDDLGQEYRASITTSEMMEKGKIGSCMIFATKMISDFREAGIPVGIAFSYNVAEVDHELHNQDISEYSIRSNFHPQNVIWTPRFGWVIYQYMVGFGDARKTPEYVGLLYTQIATDWEELYTSDLFATEKGKGYEWYYYSEDLSAPENLMQYLQPTR